MVRIWMRLIALALIHPPIGHDTRGKLEVVLSLALSENRKLFLWDLTYSSKTALAFLKNRAKRVKHCIKYRTNHNHAV